MSYRSLISGTSGLLAYWKLDEAPGATTAADSSGNGKTGTYTNTPTIGIQGIDQGGAVTFASASSQYVLGTSLASGALSDTTAIGWIKYTSAGSAADNAIYGEGSTASNTPLWLIGEGNTLGRLEAFWRNDANNQIRVTSAASSYNDGTWHMVAGVKDSSATLIRLYIDGVADNTGSYTATAITLNTSSIGALSRVAPPGNYLNGTVDEVAIFNRVLTPVEVSNIYAVGRANKFQSNRLKPAIFKPGVAK